MFSENIANTRTQKCKCWHITILHYELLSMALLGFKNLSLRSRNNFLVIIILVITINKLNIN
jgi:hypothetical protein